MKNLFSSNKVTERKEAEKYQVKQKHKFQSIKEKIIWLALAANVQFTALFLHLAVTRKYLYSIRYNILLSALIRTSNAKNNREKRNKGKLFVRSRKSVKMTTTN